MSKHAESVVMEDDRDGGSTDGGAVVALCPCVGCWAAAMTVTFPVILPTSSIQTSDERNVEGEKPWGAKKETRLPKTKIATNVASAHCRWRSILSLADGCSSYPLHTAVMIWA